MKDEPSTLGGRGTGRMLIIIVGRVFGTRRRGRLGIDFGRGHGGSAALGGREGEKGDPWGARVLILILNLKDGD